MYIWHIRLAAGVSHFRADQYYGRINFLYFLSTWDSATAERQTDGCSRGRLLLHARRSSRHSAERGCGARPGLEGAVGKWPRSVESRDGCPLQSRSSLTSIQTPERLIKGEQWHGAAGAGARGSCTTYICVSVPVCFTLATPEVSQAQPL